ncbi:hypothetical protein [Fictibacillus phosphorivorans]|uniref:hypothetical protein n=1 Tax=Fictibacillus phosphorivorans TaxID=1221500 RepID=UPI0035EE6BAC
MEISRKEKFSTKKKTAKKWPKIVLATTIALGVGGTTTFAAKPNLADYLYNHVMSLVFKGDINNELQDQEKTLVKDLSNNISNIFNGAKKELEDEKKQIVREKKEEIQTHYRNEMAEVSKRKEEALTKKKEEMNTDATKSTTEIKKDISDKIERELEKNTK